MYGIELTTKALKAFMALPAPVRKTINSKLAILADNPLKAQNVKALSGSHAYRWRVGDYRVVYTLNNSRLIITVIRVAHRREVYQ